MPSRGPAIRSSYSCVSPGEVLPLSVMLYVVVERKPASRQRATCPGSPSIAFQCMGGRFRRCSFASRSANSALVLAGPPSWSMKRCGMEDAEEQPAVHGPVVRLAEVVLDAVVDHPGQVGRRVPLREPRVKRLVVGPGEVVAPVVVRPHQGELQALAVRGLEEAVLQGLLHEPDARVPVPIEEEHVDAVVGGQVDLARGPLGVGLVEEAPRGPQRLVVAGEARRGRLHQFPFAPAVAVPGVHVVVAVPQGAVDGGDFGTRASRLVGRALRHRRQKRRQSQRSPRSAHGLQETATVPRVAVLLSHGTALGLFTVAAARGSGSIRP